MPDPDPNEFVRMTHPNIEAISRPVTRQAFDEIYKAKGWKLATAEESAAAEFAEADPEVGVALKSSVKSASATK